MTIKHLVIGGGGPGGLINYGILKEANINKIWKYNDIKTIYCCSIGSLIGLMILLKIEWSWIDDYLIKRPWNEIINIFPKDYLTLLKSKGLFNKDIISKIILPLLKVADLDINITLSELYKFFPIEFHCFSCNINAKCDEQLINISYKTHPDLLLVDAIYMTSTIPLLAKPICIDNNCYLDGGLLANIPTNECLNDTQCKLNEILVVKHFKDVYFSNVKESTNLAGYLIEIFSFVTSKLVRECEDKQTKNVLTIIGYYDNIQFGTYKYWLDVLNSQEDRKLLIEAGVNSFNKFFEKNKDLLIKFNLNKEQLEKCKKYLNTNQIIKRSYSF